jgi:hypothetical protein
MQRTKLKTSNFGVHIFLLVIVMMKFMVEVHLAEWGAYAAVVC